MGHLSLSIAAEYIVAYQMKMNDLVDERQRESRLQLHF